MQEAFTMVFWHIGSLVDYFDSRLVTENKHNVITNFGLVYQTGDYFLKKVSCLCARCPILMWPLQLPADGPQEFLLQSLHHSHHLHHDF